MALMYLLLPGMNCGLLLRRLGSAFSRDRALSADSVRWGSASSSFLAMGIAGAALVVVVVVVEDGGAVVADLWVLLEKLVDRLSVLAGTCLPTVAGILASEDVFPMVDSLLVLGKLLSGTTVGLVVLGNKLVCLLVGFFSEVSGRIEVTVEVLSTLGVGPLVLVEEIFLEGAMVDL